MGVKTYFCFFGVPGFEDFVTMMHLLIQDSVDLLAVVWFSSTYTWLLVLPSTVGRCPTVGHNLFIYFHSMAKAVMGQKCNF